MDDGQSAPTRPVNDVAVLTPRKLKKHVGLIQSLISTCHLHGINPYTYLVDVLQRVSIHPAHRVAELTPRLWKEHFADNPLRSDIYDSG